ncbi:Na+/H+ antiporter NhaA [Tessaracoccus sp. MC1756]|uniref:Na+/H+ antiporter NhaA n=1 Tax=Tessaracoccus sp. MC1756 TaxID=2760311 RepID=UPI001602C432|nr:Na+/H+ antiporter NhaA [Tessaracoccus sp. MC1756]MBB1509568.1 Na+/H+ antiporter NhaA [Tessaracoccus sp. MC1756]
MTTDVMERPSTAERLRLWVTRETTGGALLLAAAMVALIWANTPWADAYHALSEFRVGPEAWHLDLPLAAWASDGLLALFFFLVGVELKHDLVVGSLRNLKEAAVPVLAAVGGMAMPAIVFSLVIFLTGDSSAAHGWAIPTATDIAFALAVLAVFGRGLPRALRMFLMTLAVVDDLLAIIVIAVFYTSDLNIPMLLGTAAAAVAFWFVVRTRRWPRWVLVLLALAAWWFMHSSGVHATIAGVILGFCVPARPVHGEEEARTHTINNALQPYSAGLVLPIFAFFAAGVTFITDEGIGDILLQPVVLAIVAGLFIGKIAGVLLTTTLVTKLTPLRLPDAIGLRDLLPIGLVCGMGFTVSLLIADLSFADGTHTAGAKIGVLLGTAVSAIAGAIALSRDARMARRADMNLDGVPDVYTEPITGEERRGLSWHPEVIGFMDGEDIPDPDMDYMAALDGVDLDVETEFKESLDEERESRYGPSSED